MHRTGNVEGAVAPLQRADTAAPAMARLGVERREQLVAREPA